MEEAHLAVLKGIGSMSHQKQPEWREHSTPYEGTDCSLICGKQDKPGGRP